MNTLSIREHSHLARTLIAACGGLDESATHCRVSKSKLSDYSNPNVTLFTPADVIADLENYCGIPVYSRALFGRFDDARHAGDLRSAVYELTETAATLQGRVREALANNVLTQAELKEITDIERQTEDVLDKVRGARRAVEAQKAPNLKAV